MTKYFVVGGEYTDTDFKTLSGDGAEERFGPFDDFADAHEEWQNRAWLTVDNCYARYHIVDESGTPALRKEIDA